MENIAVMLMFVNVMLSALSQILLKKSALKEHKNFISSYVNVLVISAYTIFLGVIIFNSILYKNVELKTGAIIESTGVIFVMIFSQIFLGEKLDKNKIIGCALVFIGAVVSSI